MANAYTNYALSISITPQSQPISGREAEMVVNNAGGYGFILDDWERLNRFMIMGSDDGTYYVGEQKLTAENAAAVIRCIKVDGVRVVELARDVNVNNRAPKTDQQLFALALALKHGDAATKAAAREAARRMLRTGTHLLHFVAMLDSMGGWNRSKRRIIADWFTREKVDDVAFQCLKYQNRDGFRMRDVLRLVHPVGPMPEHDAVFAWTVGKSVDGKPLPHILAQHNAMQAIEGSAVDRAIWGVAHGIPREALPTEAIADSAVQRAMLADMPMHALLRNLGNLSASGVLVNGTPEASRVVEKLANAEVIRRARVHPFAILLATLIYKSGSGVRGSKTWIPVPAILSALEDAYDAAFVNASPTNKRILIAIDISGSMSAPCVGTPISASTAAVAMAVTLARMEPNALVVQFDTAVQRIVPVTKRTGIAGLEATNGGGTDVSSPIRWALGERIENGYSRLWGGGFGYTNAAPPQLHPERQEFDAFVILTDNETWAGNGHAPQFMGRYRREVNPKAKLICCSMAANHASVVDPNDPLSFGCSGLDANLPSLIGDFIGR